MVRQQNGSARTGNTPRSGAVKAKPSSISARRTPPPATSRTPPLMSSPRLTPANGGRLVVSEPVYMKTSADPATAHPRSGNLYDSPSSFLNGTRRDGPASPGQPSAGGDYVVFSSSGKHMTRRPAGQQGDASDGVAALLHGGGAGGVGTSGAGMKSTLFGARRLSLGTGGGVDRTEGTSSALTRLPTGKTSSRPAHPASGPPAPVTRQNLLLSRKGRRSQEHLAPLRREDLSLDPRKDTQRYGTAGHSSPSSAVVMTGGAGAWQERTNGSPTVWQQPQHGDAGIDGGLTSDDHGAAPASASPSTAAAAGNNRSQQLFSSLRYYTTQRLAQDQQNAAEYEAGVLGGDGNRAFALSGAGTPSLNATAARNRRASTNLSLNGPSPTSSSAMPAGAGAGAGLVNGSYNPFLTTNRQNYTGGLGSTTTTTTTTTTPAGPSTAESTALAMHKAQMPRKLVQFGGGDDDGDAQDDDDDLQDDIDVGHSGGGGGGMHHTIYPGDETGHLFPPGEDDYFEDPATDAQLFQQELDRQASAAAPSVPSSAAKGKRKGASPSPAKSGKKKPAGDVGTGRGAGHPPPAQPYDFRVVLSSGKTVIKPLQLVVGSGCVQGLRPTMEDEHVAKLSLATVREQPVSVVAILDGHCGRRVADLGAKYLPDFICQHDALGENSALAIVEAIVQTDQAIYKVLCGPPSPQQKNARTKLMNTQRQDFSRSLGSGGMNHDESGGSTLIAAVVHGRVLYVACLGDARAVLYDGRTTIALSEDHKPNNAKEMKRINQCGGFVQFGRVCGVLAVSRALGDYEFKEQAGNGGGGGGGQSGRGAGKLQFRADKELMVSNIADVRQIHLTDESKFLLLACDGLWDVISNEEATQFIRDFLLYTPEMSDPQIVSGHRPRPSPAVVERVLNNCCRKLAEYAVSAGSTDNVSVTVLFFHDVVDVVASFVPGAGAGGANTNATSAASPHGRRSSLFSQSRAPQSGRQQQQQELIDSVLMGASRGSRSGSSGAATGTTLMNGRPVRGSAGVASRGAPPSSGLENYFGGSFGRKANLSVSRGIENTFGSAGSRGLW